MCRIRHLFKRTIPLNCHRVSKNGAFRTIPFFLLFSILAHCQSPAPANSQLNYTVKVSPENVRYVEISAELYVTEPYLEMARFGIPSHIPNGWAHFVQIKSIKDVNGSEISYHWNSLRKKWRLNTLAHSKIQLNYVVKLEHDTYEWNSVGGVDGRPTVVAESTAFWVSKALFIYPSGVQEKEVIIAFDITNGWNVSTPWQQLEDQEFKTKNVETLVNNALMIGRHEERLIYHDEMSITLAVVPDLKHSVNLLEKTLGKILPVYRDIFGELPKANYLICASKHFFEDGEAFYNSFHQMFVDKDLEERTIVWGNVLAHEMFHYWNGTRFLIGDNVNTNSWFSEGFTEYYSNLALVRSGLVEKEEYLSKLAYQFSRFYSSQALGDNHPNLLDAGNEKGKNWHLIYGGGASIAFILDIEIRTLSQGKKSLDDYMSALYIKYGKTGVKLGLPQQIDELNALTNTDFTPFFDKYVIGNEFYLIPILQACAKAGLTVAQYQGEFYLKPKSGDIVFNRLIESR
ncbi:hypothetical protein [Flagellimonas flava]|uniref:M61 family metallopeptidase n=1 Tax=Flagellimonas flava TaxID=570519 RepID=UPI003D655C27